MHTPDKINEVIKKLEQKNIPTYIVGEAAASMILGQEPVDFDLVAFGDAKVIEQIFPKELVVRKDNALVQLDFTVDEFDSENPIVDLNTVDIGDNSPHNNEFIENSLKEKLGESLYNYQAIAFNPARGIFDPYSVKGDLNHNLIKEINFSTEVVESNPAQLLEVVSFAANFHMDIHKPLYEKMLENSNELFKLDKAIIRDYLGKIIISEHGGKGLRMLAGADFMPAIIGNKAISLNPRQKEQFITVCDKIHETKPILERRLGLFYACFEEKKGVDAIEYLEYKGELRRHLLDGVLLMDRLHTIKQAYELKDFMVSVGRERYEYMENLAKNQTKIFGGIEFKILSRYYMLRLSGEWGEAIWPEDLAINSNQIMDYLGVDKDRADELLVMLTDVVHRKPRLNTKEHLLKKAKLFHNHKWAAAMRKINWIK